MARFAGALVGAALAMSVALPVGAQEEIEKTTISAIERGEARAAVYLEGAVLEQVDDGYIFSDGTGVIGIGVDESDAEGQLPLFELVGIEGTVAGDGIDVSGWALLPIVTPAVIVPEEKVIEAFWGWIVAYGSQAPAE